MIEVYRIHLPSVGTTGYSGTPFSPMGTLATSSAKGRRDDAHAGLDLVGAVKLIHLENLAHGGAIGRCDRRQGFPFRHDVNVILAGCRNAVSPTAPKKLVEALAGNAQVTRPRAAARMVNAGSAGRRAYRRAHPRGDAGSVAGLRSRRCVSSRIQQRRAAFHHIKFTAAPLPTSPAGHGPTSAGADQVWVADVVDAHERRYVGAVLACIADRLARLYGVIVRLRECSACSQQGGGDGDQCQQRQRAQKPVSSRSIASWFSLWWRLTFLAQNELPATCPYNHSDNKCNKSALHSQQECSRWETEHARPVNGYVAAPLCSRVRVSIGRFVPGLGGMDSRPPSVLSCRRVIIPPAPAPLPRPNRHRGTYAT